MLSPGFAGRDGTPCMAPDGSANVCPSAKSAATYCFPLTWNEGGASSPGRVVTSLLMFL